MGLSSIWRLLYLLNEMLAWMLNGSQPGRIGAKLSDGIRPRLRNPEILLRPVILTKRTWIKCDAFYIRTAVSFDLQKLCNL
jgi:hypothetical protein